MRRIRSMSMGILVPVLCLLMAVPAVSAQFEHDRETKIRLYEIMYGDEEPESIEPALAPEDTENVSEGSGFTEEAVTEDTGFEVMTEGEDETQAWYPEFTEEKLSLPEAIVRLEEMELTDEEAKEFLERLRQMLPCQGTYFQTSTRNDGERVYTAEVEIFLKYGVPTCIIDYENYIGFLEEAEVRESSVEGYTFETWPIGKNAGYGQEFFIAFDKDHMHIVWGEGTVEHDLNKATGEADELEDDLKPFVQTEFYQEMTDRISEAMGDMEHQFAYDDAAKTLNVYIVMSKNGRQKALNNASLIKDKWDAVLESLKPISETASTAMTMAVREGLYDFTDAHCVLMIVDDLKDSNTYYPQEVWAMIRDGKVEYDFLQDSSSGSGQSTWTVTPQGSSEDTGNTGGSSYGSTDHSNTGSTADTYSYSASSGERNALQKAKDYLDFMHFSYEGLTEQLEFEGFSHSEAIYGAEHCGADWYEQAFGKAKDYLEFMSFSFDGLVEQLEFEGFTHDQAVYGANKAY